MDISKGFDGGIHAFGAVVFMHLALVLYRHLPEHSTIKRISKVNALGSVSRSASDGASFPVLIMH